jgi:two-component system, OmpR family, phosphate regulon sensor histidine kinase PhoR
MNLSTSQRLSLLAAFLIMAGFSVVYSLVTTTTGYNWNPVIFFLVNIFLFPVSFITYKVILDKFIYEKIRLIYKTIHQLKSPKKDHQKLEILQKSDIIEQTNIEVVEWAKNKMQEVSDLRKLEAYRREFLGNVSHELKTPIFNIQGYVLTLLDGGLEDPKINRTYLERTEKSIDRMISIIEDLEAISRYEAGEMKLKIEKFDVVALTHEVIDFLEIKASKKNIRLHFAQNYDSPIFVNADKQRIQQVLTNLIVNSIKYGTTDGRTKISFFDMDENILVEITDSGIGIPQEDLPRVFERFYRGDRSRTRRTGEGGSGLGLAIVKHIIEAHNQTVHVRSTMGVGSTFGFTLSKAKAQSILLKRPTLLF